MPTTNRPGLPYIWPTWITGFLAGEAHCRFRPWFQAHFRYDKREDTTFDMDAWKAQHAAAVRERVAQLEADGWTVKIEDQNKFTIKGHSALLGGKPDIVAERPVEITVNNLSKPGNKREKRTTMLTRTVDAKTGKPKGADWWQVLLYMLAARLLDKSQQPRVLEGEVFYPEAAPRIIKPEELTPKNEQAIYDTIAWVAGPETPATTPSAFECSRCDILACRDRVTAEAEATEVDVF